MADDDARNSERVVHLADQAYDDTHRNRVESDKWFVVDQNVGIHHHGSCKRNAPRHTARQLLRHHVCGTAEPYRVQLGQHDMTDEAVGQASMLAQWKRDVLEHGKISE
jgi:hemin uptake protein HemP